MKLRLRDILAPWAEPRATCLRCALRTERMRLWKPNRLRPFSTPQTLALLSINIRETEPGLLNEAFALRRMSMKCFFQIVRIGCVLAVIPGLYSPAALIWLFR